jgi:hypothetical protein
MDNQLLSNFLIGKIEDKFYIFYMEAAFGGVKFSKSSPPFHTSEDAHSFLIEKAKEASASGCKVSCIEIVRQFIFISPDVNPKKPIDDNTDDEIDPA